MTTKAKFERQKELLLEQERVFEEKEKKRMERLKFSHGLKMEEIEAEKELERLKQKNFITRRNILGEHDLNKLK